MAETQRLTRAHIHLDRLAHNLDLLRQIAGNRPLWPAIKANAYGHGAEIVARHAVALGYRTLCVADVGEAAALLDAGVEATFVTLSTTRPEHAEALVAYGCEPVVDTREMIDALADAADRAGRQVAVHVVADTGMGRVGATPDGVAGLLAYLQQRASLRPRGLMSHFPRADETDKRYSLDQLERFRELVDVARGFGVEVCHLANSAGILDVPGSGFDAVRPGISIYGLAPSASIANPRARELRPVLEWKTAITLLKEVPAGTGLSYGHAFHTGGPSLIATLPVGYGDGLSRRLSGNLDVLIHGRRCPQVGRITMDLCLVDVTALRGGVALGDEAVLIGRQGDESIGADEIAQRLGTISYEVVTAIAPRVPRIAVGGDAAR